MSKTVAELQDAFQTIIKGLKRNKRVLAVFTFGSIVSGDIWEESDIDLFLVYENEYDEIRDVYYESKEVPVHAKILCKDKFIELYDNEGKRGFVRNLLAKSKMVYCKDSEVSALYNKARYSVNPHIDKWNLVYLGNIIKDLGVCKKYLINSGITTSYEVLIRVLDNVSKLYINLNGYESTKDSLVMASNLNVSIRNVVNNLFSNPISKEIIDDTIMFIDEFLEENIASSSKLLLEYLNNQDDVCSSYEIVRSEAFKGFNINIENILKELSKRGLIVKKKRALKDKDGNKIMYEYVYLANIKNKKENKG